MGTSATSRGFVSKQGIRWLGDGEGEKTNFSPMQVEVFEFYTVSI